MSAAGDLAKLTVGLTPYVIELVREARRHPDPRRAMRVALQAMVAERTAHASVDAMIATRAKAKPPTWD